MSHDTSDEQAEYQLSICLVCGGTYPSTAAKCTSWVHAFDAEVSNALKHGYLKPGYFGGLAAAKTNEPYRLYAELLNREAFFSKEHYAEHLAEKADAERLEMARLLSAEVLGVDFDTLYKSKSEWIQDRGQRHDCNMPYKPELLDAADSILKRYEKRKDAE